MYLGKQNIEYDIDPNIEFCGTAFELVTGSSSGKGGERSVNRFPCLTRYVIFRGGGAWRGVRYKWRTNHDQAACEEATGAYYEALSLCRWNLRQSDPSLLRMAGLYAAHVAEAGDKDKAEAALHEVIVGALRHQRQLQEEKPLMRFEKLLLQGVKSLQQGEKPLPQCKKSLLNGKTSLSPVKKSLGKKQRSPGRKTRTSSTASTVLSGLIHYTRRLFQEAHSGRLPVPSVRLIESADVAYSDRAVAIARPAAPMRRGRRG